MPATPAWLAALEALLNRGIQSSFRAQALAHRLEATVLQVNATGAASIRAAVTGGTLVLAAADPSSTEPVNARIAGSPPALLNLALGRRTAGNQANAGRPTVHGDAEIANLYQQLFAAAQPDFEEELSRLVGDPAARRIAQFARRALGWARNLRRTAGENIAEYLQEESRDLVNKPELEEFLHGVDVARETADRVEARIARLEQRLKGP